MIAANQPQFKWDLELRLRLLQEEDWLDDEVRTSEEAKIKTARRRGGGE